MATGLEAILTKVVGRVAGQFVSGARAELRVRRLRDQARPLMAGSTAEALVGELPPDEASAVARYLSSPDFEAVAVRMVVSRLHRGAGAREEQTSSVREEVRAGLRLIAGERRLGLTDVIVDALVAATAGETGTAIGSSAALVAKGHVAAATARNGELLKRLTDLQPLHEQAALLRKQVAEMHTDMRMPQAGTVRSVRWDELFVEPALHLDSVSNVAVERDEMLEPGARHVVLGDPGAGKSTLAEKIAYDLASDPDGTVVPLLVVLRHFSAALAAGERTLVEHFIAVAKDPYNVSLTTDTIDYLLLSGRVVVLLDGLDELTDVALRRRVADLIKGFVLLYPQVPVVATSRRVGYVEAGLDANLFRACGIARFDDARVQSYVNHWFALDEGVRPADRARLGEAFLRESAAITDLRSSPLLLSVLCDMYATDHFIPSNRGQIYDRCAQMVFERWDRIRGISQPFGFEGRIRPAVQHLAWTLLTTGPVPEGPRGRIRRILEEHLIGKGFDEDPAREEAERFLDYCVGRAWILTEVGSTATEGIFGFAHRTFLEFFAAEYLVRRARTPEAVWEMLAPRVAAGEWEVIAQLALQLIDRNVDDGGDAVLRLALDRIGDDSARLAFAARSLGDVCPFPDVVARIVELSVARACGMPEKDRFVVTPGAGDFAHLKRADGPLYSLLYESLPGNLPFVRQALSAALGERLDNDDDIAHLLLVNLDRALPPVDDERQKSWVGVMKDLSERHHESCGRWRERHFWDALRRDSRVLDVFDKYGAWPFYVSDLILPSAGPPWVGYILAITEEMAPPDDPIRLETVTELRDRLVRSPTPWIRADSWLFDSFTVDRIRSRALPERGSGLATSLVLRLPYIEVGAFDTERGDLIELLVEARRSSSHHVPFAEELQSREVPQHVVDFLMRWVRRGLKVVDVLDPAV